MEQIIRALIAELPDLPIRADFYRGRSANWAHPLANAICYESMATPVCGSEWFVRVKPSLLEVAISAAGRWDLGDNDVIDRAVVVKLPQTLPGVVDVDALNSSSLHVELLAAIRENATVVRQMRANIAT